MKKLFALLALVCAGTLGAAEPPTGVAEYLTFSSADTFSLATGNSTKNWDGTLYYSTDASIWTEWNGTSSISSSGNGKLYLCGVGNTRIGGNTTDYRFVLTGTAISCSGNIETLLDYKTVEAGRHPTMGTKAFCSLFYKNANLISAPELPATQLSDRCYYYMFRGCTGLTVAPELPATTLADSCYGRMFYGCTSLTTAPELPATTLAEGCYNSMFYGCTGIKLSESKTGFYTRAWQIPATAAEVANWNYGMFNGTGGTFTGDPENGVIYYMEVPSLLTVHTDRLGATIAGTVQTIPAGETITIDKPTVGAGETFMGWYVDGALRTGDSLTLTPDKDMTLRAIILPEALVTGIVEEAADAAIDGAVKNELALGNVAFGIESDAVTGRSVITLGLEMKQLVDLSSWSTLTNIETTVEVETGSRGFYKFTVPQPTAD